MKLYIYFWFFGMEKHAFIIDHRLQYVFGRLKIIPVPIKWLFADWLLLWIMKGFKVRMCKTLFNCIALVWIKCQNFA